MVEWWKDVLDKWGAALSFSYNIFNCDSKETKCREGDWFRNGGDWFMQLDYSHAAHFEDNTFDESMRQALSITIRTIFSSYKESIDKQFANWMLWLSSASNDELRAALSERKALYSIPHPSFEDSGCFFWIRFENGNLQPMFGQLSADVDINQIIEAWLPDGWYIWLMDKDGVWSILLYLTTETMVNMIENEEETEPKIDGNSGKVCAESLLAMLEADASVAPYVIVSRKVESPASIYSSLVMLVVAYRTMMLGSRSERVTISENNLLLQWVQLLPNDMGRVLQNWMGINSSDDNFSSFKSEMEEVLDGLVKANLNVSEAARMLYLHRNTLIHRIERINKITGLDIRDFFDAVKLWIVIKTT